MRGSDFKLGQGRILVRLDANKAMEYYPGNPAVHPVCCGVVERNASGRLYDVSSIVFFSRGDSVDVRIGDEHFVIVKESDVVGSIKEKG